MKFNVFESDNESILLSNDILQLNKSISLFLQDLFLAELVFENRKIYLLSGQYESTQFINSIFLEEDDLVRALLDNDKVKKLSKKVIRNEGELSTEKGLLFFDDQTSMRWYEYFYRGSTNTTIEFKKEGKKQKPFELPFYPCSGPYHQHPDQVDVSIEKLERDKRIIPLNPFEKNEDYWIQYYKHNFKSGSQNGCTIAFIVIMVLIGLIAILSSL